MRFENLFKPGKIGTLELKNRLVMPAMGTDLPGEWGEVTESQINWFARRARGGAALIVVEVTLCATSIDPMRLMPRTLRADDLSYIPGLARLAEVIHENGAKAAIQLTAGGGAQAIAGPWMPSSSVTQKIQTVSPSGVPAIGHKDVPRALALDEIHRIIELCGAAAWNVQRAGFDMIEIHAHGGYLIAEFLSPYFNKRTDEYGGSLENRCRFLMDIYASLRKAVGPDFPITVKYSIDDFLPNGWDTKQSQELAKRMEEAGVNGIGISSGVHEAKMPAAPPYFYPMGIFVPFAEAIKSVVKIPVYVGGRLDDPELAEKTLKENKADFIDLGRGVIADPDWPNKVAGGQYQDIRPCLACNECRQSLFRLQPIRCSVNAAAGREGEIDDIRPAVTRKTVLVAGGGPGGMEAARIAATRGHKVILCEKQRQLGGLALLAGIHNEQVTAFVNWLIAQVKKLPVEVRLQTEVSPALVQEIKPDAVILANGGTFATPEIKGIDGENVFSAKDLLNLMNGIPLKKGLLLSAISSFAKHMVNPAIIGKMLGSNFPIKKKVIVIGGQFPGCSLALFLAQKGKKVTVLEESELYGYDMEAHTLVALNNQVKEENVKFVTSVKIEEITDKGAVIIDDKGNKNLEPADTVIVAMDLLPSDSNLEKELRGKVKELFTVGDAKSFRHIKKAVSEGYVVAYAL